MDREKVISNLQGVYEYLRHFENTAKMGEWVADALTLLKEQEAVEPKRIDGKRNHFIKCGNCNYDLVTGFQFCPHCGRAVK